MQYRIPKTLDYYLSAPYFDKKVSMGVPLLGVIQQAKKYWDNTKAVQGMVYPETEAVQFYCLNHLVSVIKAKYTPYEELPDWADEVMQEYLKCVREQSLRMFYYTLIIVTRESRHSHKIPTSFVDEARNISGDWKEIYAIIRHEDSEDAARAFVAFDAKGRLGPYVEAIDHLFNGPATWGGSYGGKSWGTVSTNLLRFMRGEVSMEAMIDTAYTLAHNNGPVFNKGMMYKMFDKDKFGVILDIQRAGQMPEFTVDKYTTGWGYDIPDKLVRCVNLVAGACGGIMDRIDWDAVKKAGSLTDSIPTHQQQAAKAYGVKVAGTYDVLGQYKVTPHQVVTIIDPARGTEVNLPKAIEGLTEATDKTSMPMEEFKEAIVAEGVKFLDNATAHKFLGQTSTSTVYA